VRDPTPTQTGGRVHDGRWILLAIALAYVSLGILFGFVQGGVAPVLRTQGVALSAMPWVYALYLPFGLAFVWTPVVDSWRWPWLGHRTGWILPMQATSVLALAAIAWIEPAPGAWGMLLALGLAATVAAATMDVALDALTVEMMPPGRRAAASAAKMGGISLGGLLGGGVLVAWYPALGWRGTLTLIAVATALSCLPVLALVGQDRRLSTRTPPHRASLIQTLRKPHMPRRFVRLTLLVCALLASFNFNRLLLVDMGVSLERIGSVLGTIAPLANALACLLTPLLLRVLPMRQAAWGIAGLCMISTATVGLGFVLNSPMTALVASAFTTVGAAGLYVVLGSLMLQWASGRQAATDYALLYGVGRLIGTLALVALPGFIQGIGWASFQSAVVIALAVCTWVFLRLFPKVDPKTPPPLSLPG